MGEDLVGLVGGSGFVVGRVPAYPVLLFVGILSVLTLIKNVSFLWWLLVGVGYGRPVG